MSKRDARLDSSADKSKLSWKRRSKICLDIAKGLKFLHEEAELDIIHCNIKPTNILLDKDFNVKLSDFIYSKAKPHDEQLNIVNKPRAKEYETISMVLVFFSACKLMELKSVTSSYNSVCRGHMAPEYNRGLPLTPKADVYSFGLVMLEIISGQPHIITKPKDSIELINTVSIMNPN